MYASVLMWPMKPADNGTWLTMNWYSTEPCCTLVMVRGLEEDRWNMQYVKFKYIPTLCWTTINIHYFSDSKIFQSSCIKCVRKKDRNRATWQSFDLISNVTYGDINLLNSWSQTNPNNHLQRLVLPVTRHSKFIQAVSSSPLEPVSNCYMCTFTEDKVLTEISYRPIYLMSLVNICVSTTLDQPTSNNGCGQ